MFFMVILIFLSFSLSMDRLKLEDIDPRMEKYFSKDIQDKLKEEKARKASTSTGDEDLKLSDEEMKEAKSPLIFPNFECKKNIPSIEELKDDIMVNNNYMKIMYRYKTFLLFVTATWCDYCCQHQEQLSKLKEILKNRTIKGEDIPLVILYSNQAVEAIRELKITYFKVPTLFLVHNKQFIQYSSYFRAPNIYRFLNNIFYPVVELNTVKQVEDFLDVEKSVDEDNDFLLGEKPELEHSFFEYVYKNRLIGFFSDIEEYDAEYKAFFRYAEKISHRNDLRIGIVTNKEIIKHFKSIHNGVWFNDHSWNSIVLRRDDKTMFLDLSLLNEHLEIFMIYNTVPYVEEISINNTALIAKITTPIMLFFIDTSFILENYYTQMKFIEYLSKEFIGKYVFMYLDGNTKTKTKEMFGLKKEMPIPNFNIIYISTNKFKTTPESFPYCDIFIKKFLYKHLGSKYSMDMDLAHEKNIKSYDDKIVANLKLTTKLKLNNYSQTLSNKKYDFIVFVVDTDYDERSEINSKYINKIGERMKALGIKTTILTTYDINENGIHSKFEGVPLINGKVFLVRGDNNKPISYEDKISVLRILKFIELNSYYKIKLPDVPHLDSELHEEYYNKKSILESYKENINKSDVELDDIINMDFAIPDSLKEKLHTDL